MLVHATMLLIPVPGRVPVEQVAYARGLISLEVRVARISDDNKGARAVYLAAQAPSWNRPPEKTLKSDKKIDSADIRNAENTSPVNSDDTPIRPLPAGVSLEQASYPTPLPKAFAEEAGPYVAEAALDESPRALRIAVPSYPVQALESGLGGRILVALLIDEGGAVITAAGIQSSEELAPYRAEIAHGMRQSLFTPGKRGGKPVRTMVFQAVNLDPIVLAKVQDSQIKPAWVIVPPGQK